MTSTTPLVATLPVTKPPAPPTVTIVFALPPPVSQTTPTLTPPTPTPVNANPWGYNFAKGNLIYRPNAHFCRYFRCSRNFWKGTGYVVQCQDGSYAKSGGEGGSCSKHGGDLAIRDRHER